MSSTIIESVREVAEPVGRAEGVNVVDIELAGTAGSLVLKIYIDKDGGVTVEDCARVSSQLGLVLEAEETIKNAYTLEVSSMGLTRKLKKPLDFQQSIGSLAMIKTRGAVIPGGKTLVTIDDANNDNVTVTIKDSGDKLTLSYSDIARANLEIEF
ncbi:Bacterial ribosome SSU maturation protein RimP [hydrothermal vent metagenome]|uniref:Bacterial ribosome SSU maturation protein RimP n=1 Tax=hydrothermal vent metagenome TaxID=652676 RepID=A0A3B1CWZ9_9ZZZZ